MAKLMRSGGEDARVLYVPVQVWRQIPEDTEFKCELTEEGVLFRYIPPSREKEPKWLRDLKR